jgi:hypothetical protein
MCILSPQQPHASRVASLPAPARHRLPLDALAGVPVSQIAQDHQVSRQFVYKQLHHAQGALEGAFATPPDDPPQPLFWLPVSRPWLRQLVPACHSSLRGVGELLADLFDYPLSVGTVHNVRRQAVATAGSRAGRR